MEANQTFQKIERSYEEMIEDIKQNAIISIATSIKNQNAPFLKHQNIEDLQRAYNANTGASYSGINSLLLDMKKAEMGYKTNQWVNTLQAQMLGATKEEIEAAKSKWQENSVKIHYIQTKEKVPTFSDKPLLDENGNQRTLKNGSPAFEYARNEYGSIKFETRNIDPVLKEERLYNIANFPSIKQERIKALNPEIERKHIYTHMKNGNKSMGVILEDIAQSLHPTTREQIETYFKAQNYGKAYNVPMALNERQKEQVNAMIDDFIKKLKKAKALDNVYKYLQGQGSDVSDFKFNIALAKDNKSLNSPTRELIEKITNAVDKTQDDIIAQAGKEQKLLSRNVMPDDIKPEFGTNYPQYYHKPQEAITHLLETQEGQVAGAFYRKELGDIDLVWGNENLGLQKIIEKHLSKGDFKAWGEGEEALIKGLSDIVENGKVISENGVDTIWLKKNDEYYLVGLSKGYDGIGENKWVITSYKKDDITNVQKEKVNKLFDDSNTKVISAVSEFNELRSPNSTTKADSTTSLFKQQDISLDSMESFKEYAKLSGIEFENETQAKLAYKYTQARLKDLEC